MYFLEQQYIDIENLLSYRTRVDITKLGALIEYVRANADALGLEVTGNIIFTVLESIGDRSKNILDIEILLPVNKPFESNEHYVYKPKFRLVNAISARFSGLCTGLSLVGDELAQYLLTNKLDPISNIYYVDADNSSASDEIFDAYVSVNGNMV